MSFKDIDVNYSALVIEIEKEMNRIGEEDKYKLLKSFKRKYIRGLDKRDAD